MTWTDSVHPGRDGSGLLFSQTERLVFNGEGCWEVTGQVGDESLTLVVWVCPTADFADVVSTADREACGAT